jgi:hypothetical protein
MINYEQWKELLKGDRLWADFLSEDEFRSRFTWDATIIANYWTKHPEERAVVLHELTKAVLDAERIDGFALDNTEGRFVFLEAPQRFEDGSLLVTGYYPKLEAMALLLVPEDGAKELPKTSRWGFLVATVLLTTSIFGATLMLKKKGR